MGVLRPVKLVLENYPEGQFEEMELVNNPENPGEGTRRVAFGRELWIDADDFMVDPPKKFFRLAPGSEVRLRAAYLVTCTDFVQNEQGEVVEIRATYDPETRGGSAPDGRRVKGTLHWLSAAHAVPAEVRLYEPLFEQEDPAADERPLAERLRPDSRTVLADARVEPALADLPVGEAVQFERTGYFVKDPDSEADRIVFNRIVALRDTWAKVQRNA
jgi:glutaminyl-tRNA synthetase